MKIIKEYLKKKESYVDDFQLRNKKDCHNSSSVKVYEEKDVLKALEMQKEEYADKLELHRNLLAVALGKAWKDKKIDLNKNKNLFEDLLHDMNIYLEKEKWK